MRLAVVPILLLAVACGADRSLEHGQADICRPAPGSEVAVSDAWVRPAAAGQSTTAAYFTICYAGEGDDALLSVSTPSAAAAEIHRSTRDSDGVVGMAQVDRLDLPHGVAVALEPGGTHVMLIGVEGGIAEHGAIDLTLHFEKAEPLVIRAEAGAGPSAHEGH